MLVNPYPYESESANSWAAVFREGEIYSRFKVSHVERPWNNGKLAVSFSEKSEEALSKRSSRKM